MSAAGPGGLGGRCGAAWRRAWEPAFARGPGSEVRCWGLEGRRARAACVGRTPGTRGRPCRGQPCLRVPQGRPGLRAQHWGLWEGSERSAFPDVCQLSRRPTRPRPVRRWRKSRVSPLVSLMVSVPSGALSLVLSLRRSRAPKCLPGACVRPPSLPSTRPERSSWVSWLRHLSRT